MKTILFSVRAVLVVLTVVAFLSIGPAFADSPETIKEGNITLRMGERKVVVIPGADPKDSGSVFSIVYEAKRSLVPTKPVHQGNGGLRITEALTPQSTFTFTEVCWREGKNVFGQTLWTHQQNQNLTFDDVNSIVKLNWADLAGTGTSYPGWQVDSTSGPNSNPGVGQWTGTLDVWSNAQFSLRFNGNPIQTVTSGITYHSNGTLAGSSCSYR